MYESMDQDNNPDSLSWINVAFAFSFILVNAFLSTVFRLDIGFSLITAAIRCIVQLALVGTILQKVFEADNPWAVAAIALLLNLLGTVEVVANKSKRRHNHIVPSVLIGLLGSTIPISVIGSRFAMSEERFWKPSQYIPVVGMLCGNTISGVVVSLNYVLKEIDENRDRIETYLAFGASRVEATQPIVKEALLFALTPTINQMSVIGIISIPGMMTGAILGGSSVTHAAKLQMIIMFMISACTALASITCTTYAVSIIVDGEHRVRPDRVRGSYSWPSLFQTVTMKLRKLWRADSGRGRGASRASLLPHST
ncbi:hypothetical protein E1B28_001925 [Marasmius oreades]|uniref:Uncharacterized protein n=1 Tax=Marasmius oreades TaxID=181124 RepID=A0A9P7V4E6_9AGAR|nr:uncharacterized protein E1B28_001925 [Marasmius oreades]KAG7100146.1 hypothetical protein E1B28_001925 [Marasmius oreades]